MQKCKIGFVVTVSGRWPEELPQKRLKEYGAWVREHIDADIIVYEQPARTGAQVKEAIAKFRAAGVDLVIMVYGAFTGDDTPCALAEELKVPLILWAPGEPAYMRDDRLYANDYCSAAMNSASLHRLKLAYHVLLGGYEDARIDNELRSLVRAYGLIKNMRGRLFGLFGYRPTAFYNSTFDEALIRSAFGVRIEATELKTVFDRMEQLEEEEIKQDMKCIGDAYDPAGLPQGHLENHSRLFLALRQVWREAGYDYAAIKCWPEMGGAHTQPCAVLGRLADEGFLTSCEGDVDAGLTMMAQHLLTNLPPFIADIIDMNEADNRLVFWHCGNPAPSLFDKRDGVTINNHPLVGQGTAFYGALKPGVVTIARLCNIHGEYKLFLLKGNSIQSQRITKGAMMEVAVDMPVRAVWNTILREGTAHHYSIVWQDIADDLRLWAALKGIELIEP